MIGNGASMLLSMAPRTEAREHIIHHQSLREHLNPPYLLVYLTPHRHRGQLLKLEGSLEICVDMGDE